jgi:hypothetical protein
MAVGTIKLHVINHDSPFFFSTLSRSTKFRIPDVTVLFSVRCPVQQNCMVPGVTVPSLSTLSRSTKHMVPDVTVPFLSNLSLSTEFYGTRRDCHFSITCPVQRNSMVLGVAVPFLSTLSRSTKFYRVPRFPYTRN